jgi:hypothetical protein
VTGFDHGYVRVLGDGKETTVFIVNIDSGWDEQYAPGKWRERHRVAPQNIDAVQLASGERLATSKTTPAV